jgi:hypothetical protein
LAKEVLQRFGAGGVFLDVDAGFFAQDQAEQGFEDAAVALRFAAFVAVAAADEEAAWDERLDALREAVGEDVERVETRVAIGADFLQRDGGFGQANLAPKSTSWPNEPRAREFCLVACGLN